MAFSLPRLAAALDSFPRPRRYLVAFSGGLDSSVLLHALARLRGPGFPELTAWHVNHRLQAAAESWADHCAAVCSSLSIPLQTWLVDARPARGESPEAAARRARYGVFEAQLAATDQLLTAHHGDDQAETVLQHFLRGAGPHGLAGMPPSRPLGAGVLVRPLLGFRRLELLEWASGEALDWIEDPSNADTGFDRNFLRHDILPALERWRSGVGTVLRRNAALFAETASLLDEIAAEDLAASSREDRLSVMALRRLSSARTHNLLRLWLRRAGLPAPDSRNLMRIVDEILPAERDAEPRVNWPGAEVRRYRDELYAIPPLPSVDPDWQRPIKPGETLALPDGVGQIALNAAVGSGLSATRLAGRTLTVGFRQGGERCQPAGRAGHRELKALLQEAGVPPWQRQRLPLLRVDGELAAAAGLCVAEPFAAKPGETGFRFEWLHLRR